MVIYKDDNKKIDIISHDEEYETSSRFFTEKQYDKIRYYILVSNIFEDFFDKDKNWYSYENSEYNKIREIIKANKYPELSNFIRENTLTVAIDARKGQKTRTFFDKKYTDTAFDLISLYHRLNKEKAYLLKVQKSLKSRAFLAPAKASQKQQTVESSIKLVDQALNALCNNPDRPYVNKIARLVHDQIMFKFNTKTYLGQSEIKEITLKDIPELDTETKNYFKHLSQHLSAYTNFVSKDEYTK